VLARSRAASTKGAFCDARATRNLDKSQSRPIKVPIQTRNFDFIRSNR
jgi:hypothetical protein